MAKIWHVLIGGEQHGPLSNSELRSLAATRKLTPNDKLWKEGLPEWIPATKLKGLFPPEPPEPIHEPKAPRRPSNSATSSSSNGPISPTEQQSPSTITIETRKLPRQTRRTGFSCLGIGILCLVCLAIVIGLAGWLATLFLGNASVATQSIAKLLSPITKEEFRAKLSNVRRENPLSKFEDHQKLKEAIIQTLGKPSRTQTIGDNSFWYWQCQDGLIQMEVYADFGYFYIQDVNDY